uniref:ATP synthase complex subunit 8 n=1 Tax=Mengenilla australiensis TaxID=701070 RepID=D2K8L6_9NEOP|nr:ATPase 8 [Mengenilla australiensis]
MPQMNPIYWLLMFIFMIFNLILLTTKIYFMKIKYFKLKNKNNPLKFTMKW